MTLVDSCDGVLGPRVIEHVEDGMISPHEVNVMLTLGSNQEVIGCCGDVMTHHPGELSNNDAIKPTLDFENQKPTEIEPINKELPEKTEITPEAVEI